MNYTNYTPPAVAELQAAGWSMQGKVQGPFGKKDQWRDPLDGELLTQKEAMRVMRARKKMSPSEIAETLSE